MVEFKHKFGDPKEYSKIATKQIFDVAVKINPFAQNGGNATRVIYDSQEIFIAHEPLSIYIAQGDLGKRYTDINFFEKNCYQMACNMIRLKPNTLYFYVRTRKAEEQKRNPLFNSALFIDMAFNYFDKQFGVDIIQNHFPKKSPTYKQFLKFYDEKIDNREEALEQTTIGKTFNNIGRGYVAKYENIKFVSDKDGLYANFYRRESLI